jgi:hypothetical protein
MGPERLSRIRRTWHNNRLHSGWAQFGSNADPAERGIFKTCFSPVSSCVDPAAARRICGVERGKGLLHIGGGS